MMFINSINGLWRFAHEYVENYKDKPKIKFLKKIYNGKYYFFS